MHLKYTFLVFIIISWNSKDDWVTISEENSWSWLAENKPASSARSIIDPSMWLNDVGSNSKLIVESVDTAVWDFQAFISS